MKLRVYYKQYRSTKWLFEGAKGGKYSTASLRKIWIFSNEVHISSQNWGINAPINKHTSWNKRNSADYWHYYRQPFDKLRTGEKRPITTTKEKFKRIEICMHK